jgi:hypothetical protein
MSEYAWFEYGGQRALSGVSPAGCGFVHRGVRLGPLNHWCSAGKLATQGSLY